MFCSFIEQSEQSRMLKAPIDLLMNKLDLLIRKASTGCDMEAIRHKVPDAKGDMKKSVGSLCHHILRSYASI